MRRESKMFHLREYFRDPDFWVFVVSLALSPVVFFNLMA